MRFCNLLCRVKDRVLQKQKCDGKDNVALTICAVIGTLFGIAAIIALVLNIFATAGLIGNHIVYTGVYNLTTGCSLISDKCERRFAVIGKGTRYCSGNDVLLPMLLYPLQNTDVALCCVGEIEWFNVNKGCVVPGMANIIILSGLILVGGIFGFVCWRFIHHVSSCFHDAKEIYLEEVALAEVKVN